MVAGRLNRRIALLKPAEAQDGSGHPVTTWATADEVWASVEATQGSERLAVQQQYADVSHVFTIRYRDDVSPKWRILYDSRTFRIQSVTDDKDARRFLAIAAVEEVPARA